MSNKILLFIYFHIIFYLKQPADTDDNPVKTNFKKIQKQRKMCKDHTNSVKVGKKISTGCALTHRKKNVLQFLSPI